MGNVQLVTFLLGDQRYALHLDAVERVITAAEITLLPKGPEIVLGLINIKGRIIPALNVRRRFRLQEREMKLEDHFIIARTPRRVVALPVDAASEIIEITDQDVTRADEILQGLEHVEGVVRLKDGMLLIHDLERFLSLDEEKVLDEALKEPHEG